MTAQRCRIMNDDARYRDILVYIDEGYFDVDLVGNMTLLNPSMASVPYQNNLLLYL